MLRRRATDWVTALAAGNMRLRDDVDVASHLGVFPGTRTGLNNPGRLGDRAGVGGDGGYRCQRYLFSGG